MSGHCSICGETGGCDCQPHAMTQADPVAVAEGLTPSVRDFVLMPLYSVHCEGISAAWLCDTGYWAGREVKRLGLATRQPIYPGTVASIPTPLGLAVRAALLNEDRRHH